MRCPNHVCSSIVCVFSLIVCKKWLFLSSLCCWWNSSDVAPWIRNPWSPNPFVITKRNVKEQWDFFGGLTAAIEPYPLKPSKNLLILIPTPIPAAPQHCLHPDTLTPWSGPLSLIPRSTLLLLLNKCTPPIQECSTLLRNDGCARRSHKAYMRCADAFKSVLAMGL